MLDASGPMRRMGSYLPTIHLSDEESKGSQPAAARPSERGRTHACMVGWHIHTNIHMYM